MAQGSACAWAPAAPELTLPEGEVKGVLRGSSRNLSTTCTGQKGTGGPEAIYVVRLTERTLLDIGVVSQMDTVLAIRRVCDDPLTELACSDDSGTTASPFPTPDATPDVGVFSAAVDAGSPLPGSDARNPHLRATLEAGDYFLLVDEAAPFGVGGEFQLEVHTWSPPAQTSCAGTPLVSDGSQLVDEELDLARDPSPCSDGEPRPALYYRAVIPSGQRLTARAVPTAGDRAWTPALQAFTSCSPGGASNAGANVCLTSNRADPEVQPVLSYVNNGPSEQTVLLAVSSLELVKNARFRLEIAIAEPVLNVSCATAHPLSDGLVLRNQDLSKGQIDVSTSSCQAGGGPALFYQATLYPLQLLQVQAKNVSGGGSPPRLLLRESCSDVSCYLGDGYNSYFNNDSAPRTVIVEATGFTGGTFDLHVTMPLPPGGISVRAAPRSTTSEAGGQARFEVVLDTPAFEPVDIPVASGDPAEGKVSPTSLRFTADNWNEPQTVTVTGVDDNDRDGSRSYNVTVGPSTSPDKRYAGLSGGSVALINRDDEPGFSFEAPAALLTSESGTRSTFKVVLNRAPSETVRLPLSSSDEGEGKVSPAELVFEPDSWNQPQTVTLTGIDDDERDGSQIYQVVTGTAVSGDSRYQGIDPADLPARNADNDFERVAAQVVSGNLYCKNDNYGPRLAADQARNLYAVMHCQTEGGMVPPGADAGAIDSGTVSSPHAFVAVSLDGGRTFEPPIDTGLSLSSEVVVAAGTPGVALVAGNGPSGFAVVRSEDSGATWGKPMMLWPSEGRWTNYIRMAAAGDRILLAAHTELGNRFWFSEDGGRTFQSWRLALNAWRLELGLDSDGTIWIATVGDENAWQFRTSRDGGKTFSPGRLVGDWLFWVTAGPGLVFGTGSDLVVLPRDGSGSAQSFRAVPEHAALTTVMPVADDRDNVVVLSGVYTVDGFSVQARRLGSGETKLSIARSIAVFDQFPGEPFWGVALGDNATAVLLGHAGQASVAVETWP